VPLGTAHARQLVDVQDLHRVSSRS
jgi:hypothetical protein